MRCPTSPPGRETLRRSVALLSLGVTNFQGQSWELLVLTSLIDFDVSVP